MLKEKNGAGGAVGRNALVLGRERLCLQRPVVRGVRILKGRKRRPVCVFGQESLVTFLRPRSILTWAVDVPWPGPGGASGLTWEGAGTDRRLCVMVGAVTPGPWAPRVGSTAFVKAQKSLGLQEWGEEGGVSVAAASPRRGLWCGRAPEPLPGVTGLFCVCFFCRGASWMGA